jgi:hypothetical protein
MRTVSRAKWWETEEKRGFTAMLIRVLMRLERSARPVRGVPSALVRGLASSRMVARV